jgi:hypothetical protein
MFTTAGVTWAISGASVGSPLPAISGSGCAAAAGGAKPACGSDY